nr:uncharacterized protein LOC127298826 isoform X1 [Lolium perenne]
MEERTSYWKSQGKEAFARGDYLTAISCYDKVLDINPSDTPMHANKSLCWLHMRHGGLALEEAHKCKMIRPRWSKAWYREGAALSFMKDYDGAADAFWEALQLDPKSEEIREALRPRRLRRSHGACSVSNHRYRAAQREGTTENSSLFPLTYP